MEDFGRVLDSIARSENPHEVMINVTGGEPLMRADLEQCGRMMYDKGFPWGMVSNGFALTEKRYLSLLSSGLRAMTISLDGIGETHEWSPGFSCSSFLQSPKFDIDGFLYFVDTAQIGKDLQLLFRSGRRQLGLQLLLTGLEPLVVIGQDGTGHKIDQPGVRGG